MVETKKEVKALAKAAETAKPEAPKAEVKPAAPVKKEETKDGKAAPKKSATRAAAAKKEPVKKEAAKKETPAKKAAPKKAEELKASVHFQFDGKDVVAKDVLEEAVKAFKSAHKDVEIKDIQLYIVASEGAAYYVVNGDPSEDCKIML